MSFIEDVKRKKELDKLDDQFVSQIIKDYFKEKKLETQNPRSGKYKKAVKEIRAILRRKTGVFLPNADITLPKSLQDRAGHIKVLEKYPSTRERIGIYKELYKKIFAITGKPKKIMDLACGYNPFSYPFLGCRPDYVAIDINGHLLQHIQAYFKKMNINGSVMMGDMRLLEFAKADICFIFKAVDVLEKKKGHKEAEKLLKKLKCPAVVSFSTKTLSGRNMGHPYRGWIEQLCKRLGWKFETLVFENEIFYVIFP